MNKITRYALNNERLILSVLILFFQIFSLWLQLLELMDKFVHKGRFQVFIFGYFIEPVDTEMWCIFYFLRRGKYANKYTIT